MNYIRNILLITSLTTIVNAAPAVTAVEDTAATSPTFVQRAKNQVQRAVPVLKHAVNCAETTLSDYTNKTYQYSASTLDSILQKVSGNRVALRSPGVKFVQNLAYMGLMVGSALYMTMTVIFDYGQPRYYQREINFKKRVIEKVTHILKSTAILSVLFVVVHAAGKPGETQEVKH
jgi:hypothetical protein